MIIQLLATLGFPALIAALITTLLNHRNSKQLEKFKANLAKEAAEQKAEIDKTIFEYQTCFSRLHQKRADVIAELYKRLRHTEDCFQFLTRRIICNNDPPDEQVYKELNEQARAFIVFFTENRIFLDEPLCLLIDSFVKALTAGTMDYDFWHSDELSREDKTDFFKRVEQARDSLPRIRTEIELLFRSLLGVPSPPTQPTL